MTVRSLVILANAYPDAIPDDRDLVVCADSGLEAALEKGLYVDILVGDMDSVSKEALSRAEDMGVDIRRYPCDKDMSDGEIAVRAAVELGARDIMIIGGRGGRMDHILASVLLPYLFSDDIKIEVLLEGERFVPLKKGDRYAIAPKYSIVSIIPMDGSCSMTSHGLKWELEDEDLDLGSTRGIHNEIVSSDPYIQCMEGKALIYLSERD